MPFLSLRSTPAPFSFTLNVGKQIKHYNNEPKPDGSIPKETDRKKFIFQFNLFLYISYESKQINI
jgi:hypothetical protein